MERNWRSLGNGTYNSLNLNCLSLAHPLSVCFPAGGAAL